MNSSLQKRHKATAAIICVMVHCLILIGIVIIELRDPAHEPIILIADLEHEDSRTPMSQEQWVAMNNSLPNAQFMHTPQQAQPSPTIPKQEAASEIPEPIDIAQEQPKPQPQEKLIDESLDEVVALATQFLQERTKPIEKPIPPKKEPAIAQQETPEIAPKPKQITLAQIAQGFVSQIQQEAPMAVDSNAQGQASMQQLQQMHYCQKIIGCVVNSYKINRYDSPTSQQNNRLCIHLAINQDGTIHTLRLVQSSGNHSLDQFALAVFKDASSSFPPLPQTFKQLPFHLPFFNIDRIESLQTTQGWYIDSRRS